MRVTFSFEGRVKRQLSEVDFGHPLDNADIALKTDPQVPDGIKGFYSIDYHGQIHSCYGSINITITPWWPGAIQDPENPVPTVAGYCIRGKISYFVGNTKLDLELAGFTTETAFICRPLGAEFINPPALESQEVALKRVTREVMTIVVEEFVFSEIDEALF